MVHWLLGTPPLVIVLVVAVVVGVESLGVPLPGETVLVAAALLAQQGSVSPVAVAVAAATGASVGDSLGYGLGRRYGDRLLRGASRRFPRHLGAEQIASATGVVRRRGGWAVFTGRFIALLRILAGPLAGTLHMPYRRFLVANVAGAAVWSGVTVTVVVLVGEAAERWFSDLALWGAGAVVLAAVVAFAVGRRRARHRPGEPAVARTPAGS